jgi:hypothetical protein
MKSSDAALVLALLAAGLPNVAGQDLPKKRCATLTWPDGHETTVGTFDENLKFLEACEQAAGKCKLDGVPFPSKDPKGRTAARILAEAASDCTLGPLPPTEKKKK